ncbi:hypothetical protein BDM02DRAFT_3109955 [Thelephora ganbajun]|uniref:Uncharacterized protein n=1 Tax=Thelephora ganbajun TaxID=370292 RepID=A0ACB6ZQY9_THEGA|nr:hypothetical protein BDM02DRAFT_3109955 [Thelephora ganbajun]
MATVDNVVSSSSKLWAVPSKEWVIPAKPKPGRKPKGISTPANEDKEGDPGARRNNNRAAQRAFRERKQSQLAELQARIQVYEQGETERSVALQNLARRYKEENERLRAENAALQQKIVRLETEKLIAVAALYQPRKRPVSDDDTVLVQSTKRAKTLTEPFSLPLPTLSPYPPSPSSTPSVESSSSPKFEARSVSHRAAPPENSLFPNHPNESDSLVRTSVADDTDSPFEKFDCGFCDDNTPCVCREIFQQHVADRIGRPNQPTIKIDHVEAPGIASSTSRAQSSTLDHLPAYQPAVPLRRKALNKQTTGGNLIFPVTQPPPLPPTCSGDPRNCRACASDDFGKAFCDAVNDSMAESEAVDATGVPGDSTRQSFVKAEPGEQRMVPCDDAWRQLKSHPNVEFSDLKLLAEVVASRSKCTGPRVLTSPALGSVTSERVVTPTDGPSRRSYLKTLPRDILDTQDGTVVTGHRRVGIREVPMEAVQAALDLLDAKSSMSLV